VNEREEQLRAALIELESGDDDGDDDPVDSLPAAVKNSMSDAEKQKLREDASASKEEGDEEIIERANTLTEILKMYVEGKIADSNDSVL